MWVGYAKERGKGQQGRTGKENKGEATDRQEMKGKERADL